MMFPTLISVSLAPGSYRFCASAGFVAAAIAIARTATILANPIASSPRTSDLATSGRRLERIVLLSSLRNHGWADRSAGGFGAQRGDCPASAAGAWRPPRA